MRGFTIFEIIIVIGIFIALAAAGATPLLFLKNKNALVNAAERSVSLLSAARTQTLSSENAARYGVHFAPDRAVLFKGTSFNANDPENEQFFFGSAVENAMVSLNGGGTDVVFKRLTGETDGYGTITFRLKKDPTVTRIITVERTGVVSTE
ncbi:MAG: hypothetical protein HYY60_00620 [Parcubacteria group bacterium]|nr:hypothetical protein [Parcubacteria group bacterium]MBI3075184.1 hypothetical protein [Parcubacteria group bacterium]